MKNLTKSLREATKRTLSDPIEKELYEQNQLTLMYKRMRAFNSKIESNFLIPQYV